VLTCVHRASRRIRPDAWRRRTAAGAAATWIAVFGTVATAQVAPPQVKSVTPGSTFVWLDGSYQSIHLPDFGLGFFETSTTTFEKIRAVHTFKPRIHGEGISGGIGIALSPGSLPGANARVALVGRFVDADATQSIVAGSNGNVIQLLDGFLIGPCGTCELPTRLATNLRSGQVGLNVATEIPAHGFLIIPSFEILGGASRVTQIYSQARVVAGGPTAYYDSDTKTSWYDAGAKMGLTISAALTSNVDFSLGGTFTAAYRHATLNGSDRLDDGFGFVATSTIGLSRSTVAVIPGLEAQIRARPWPGVQIRAFGGIERDSRVPGIIAPSFTPDQFLAGFATGTVATPASIGFSAHTSVRVGGGITAAFTP
jgi:hypothetical protein